jgi:hypothetical protein
MLISPVKSIRKPPLIEPVKLGKLSDSANALGNSIQLTNTKAGNLKVLQVLGETVGKKAVFGTATVTVTGVASLPFTGGANLTFSGFATTANNKTVTLSSISGLVMTFPAATFTAATEVQGTITDGTNTVNIAVSPDNPQTLTSLLNFDLISRTKNLLTYPYYDTTQTLNGITFTDNGDGSITVNGTATASAYFDFIHLGSQTARKIFKKGTYTLSGGNSINCRVIFSHDAISHTSSTSATTFVLENNVGDGTCYIYVPTGATISNVAIRPMLEFSSSATTWEKGIDLPATVPLKDTSNNQLELRGIPATFNVDGSVATWSAQDKVVKGSDGKWKLRRDIEQETVSGGTTGYTDLGTVARVQKTMQKLYNYIAINNTSAGASNYLKFLASFSSDTEHFYGGSAGGAGSATLSIFINKARLATQDLAGVNAYLAANPLTFMQLVATPVEIELSAADQTALNSVAKTFAGTTNIMLSDAKGQVYVELDQWSESAMR